MGTPLLNRRRDGVRLTAAGTALLETARDVLSAADHAVSQTRQAAGLGRPRSAFGGGLHEVTSTYGGGVRLMAGHGSVAVPGAWSGMGTAHERHGRVDWSEVLAPAIAQAREGYRLGPAAATYLALVGHDIYGWCEDSAALLVPGGRVVEAGGGVQRQRRLRRSIPSFPIL